MYLCYRSPIKVSKGVTIQVSEGCNIVCNSILLNVSTLLLCNGCMFPFPKSEETTYAKSELGKEKSQ